MKQAIFNAIIAVLGLGLAAFMAWNQLTPQNDRIEVVNEGLADLSRSVHFEPHGSLDYRTGSSVPVVGPVIWKIRVHNASDRSVSIVSFSAFLLTDDGREIYYSAMREQLSPLDASLTTQVLPDNIDARETKAYFISLSIPFQAEEGGDPDCAEGEPQLNEFQRCLFLKGRDLFGNTVTARLTEVTDPQKPIFVSWDDAAIGPRFKVVLETADGSTFGTELSYFPF